MAEGFNLGTKRISCGGGFHVIMWFMIIRRALKKLPLNITLAFLVAAGFCIVFSYYYLSVHQSHVILELKTKMFRLTESHLSLFLLNVRLSLSVQPVTPGIQTSLNFTFCLSCAVVLMCTTKIHLS